MSVCCHLICPIICQNMPQNCHSLQPWGVSILKALSICQRQPVLPSSCCIWVNSMGVSLCHNSKHFTFTFKTVSAKYWRTFFCFSLSPIPHLLNHWTCAMHNNIMPPGIVPDDVIQAHNVQDSLQSKVWDWISLWKRSIKYFVYSYSLISYPSTPWMSTSVHVTMIGSLVLQMDFGFPFTHVIRILG